MAELNEVSLDHIIVRNEIKHSYLVSISDDGYRNYHWDITKAKLFSFNEAKRIKLEEEGILYAF